MYDVGMKGTRIVIVWLLAGAGLLAAAGIAESGAERTTEAHSVAAVRIGTLRGPTSVGMAPLLGQPERTGPAIEPEFNVYGTPDLLVSQILAGEVDIAALPTNLAANLFNRGVELQLLAISGGGVLYVVADEDLGWEDLQGRTIHTLARGTTPDILFQALARQHGIDPDRDLDLRYSADQTELAQQLIAGRARLAVVPEPFVTRVLNANPRLRVAIDLGDGYREHFGGDTYPMTAMVVMRGFAERYPEQLQTFTDAYAAGLRWFAENRSEGAEPAAKKIGIPAPVIVEAFDRLNMVYLPAASVRDDVARFLEIFYEFNPQSVGGRLPSPDFYRD